MANPHDASSLHLEGRPADVGAPPDARLDLLHLRDIWFAYPDGVQAVAGIDLTIRAGEILSFVGPSGCGKSTLLSIVAGLIRPNSGSVVWNEDAKRDLTAGQRRLFTLVFQKDTLLPG